MFNFVDWIKNIDLYAIVDGIILLTIAILFIISLHTSATLECLCC